MHLERKLFLTSIFLFLVLIIVSSIANTKSRTNNESMNEITTLTIGTKNIKTEVVRDEVSRSRGLGGRMALDSGAGMLFIFDSSDVWGIWMKDMKISIDVLWLDSKGKIVFVEENMSPESYPKIFFPTTRSRYVLELAQGAFRASGASLGDVIDLSHIISSQ